MACAIAASQSLLHALAASSPSTTLPITDPDNDAVGDAILIVTNGSDDLRLAPAASASAVLWSDLDVSAGLGGASHGASRSSRAELAPS